jgi:hypothetical protein
MFELCGARPSHQIVISLTDKHIFTEWEGGKLGEIKLVLLYYKIQKDKVL